VRYSYLEASDSTAERWRDCQPLEFAGLAAMLLDLLGPRFVEATIGSMLPVTPWPRAARYQISPPGGHHRRKHGNLQEDLLHGKHQEDFAWKFRSPGCTDENRASWSNPHGTESR
jgi:hypothetical protein